MQILDNRTSKLNSELEAACLSTFIRYCEGTQHHDWDLVRETLADKFTVDFRSSGMNKIMHYTREQYITHLQNMFPNRKWVADRVEVNEFREMLGRVTQKLTITYHHETLEGGEFIESYRGTFHKQYVVHAGMAFMTGMIVEMDESGDRGNHFKHVPKIDKKSEDREEVE